MTVKELIKVLEQRPSNSKVCVSVKGNTYDARWYCNDTGL